MTDTTGWREHLRASGHRLTPQRELVLAAVEHLEHATPEQVFNEVRTHSSAINLSTVYRTLELLDELDLIRHAHIEDRAPTYHAATGHEHFHLVCRVCHRVISVEPARAAGFVTDLAEHYDFIADLGHLSVFGTCRECHDAEMDQAEPTGNPET